MMFSLLFAFHLALTFALTGIIWFVTLIHYPILSDLPPKVVVSFEKKHVQKTMRLAVPLLSLELLSGILLLIVSFTLLSGFVLALLCISTLLLVPIWILTWRSCVPSHYLLGKKCESSAMKRLYGANLSRAILWSIRSLLLFVIALLL